MNPQRFGGSTARSRPADVSSSTIRSATASSARHNNQDQQSLAKFYEYRDLRPGPFSNFWLATGSKDGLYQIDVTGKNVGYDDQRYYSRCVEGRRALFQLPVGPDAAPLQHERARPSIKGVGTTNLTLPPGYVPDRLHRHEYRSLPQYRPISASSATPRSANYRWTPDDAWDIKADYSHMHRTGTQVDGVIGFGGSFGFGPDPGAESGGRYHAELRPERRICRHVPVGQEVQFQSWPITVRHYTDDFTSYTIAEPDLRANQSSPFARAIDVAQQQRQCLQRDAGRRSAVEEPLCRYAELHDDAAERFVHSDVEQSEPPGSTSLPASSLNGAINTLLSNNIVTTKITPELTSKLSYRYYNFDNQTPEIFFPCTGAPGVSCTTAWISFDKAQLAKSRSTACRCTTPNKTPARLELAADARNGIWAPPMASSAMTGRAPTSTSPMRIPARSIADWKPMSWFAFRSSGYLFRAALRQLRLRRLCREHPVPRHQPRGPPRLRQRLLL